MMCGAAAQAPGQNRVHDIEARELGGTRQKVVDKGVGLTHKVRSLETAWGLPGACGTRKGGAGLGAADAPGLAVPYCGESARDS